MREQTSSLMHGSWRGQGLVGKAWGPGSSEKVLSLSAEPREEK